jgi:hypothetical protein
VSRELISEIEIRIKEPVVAKDPGYQVKSAVHGD